MYKGFLVNCITRYNGQWYCYLCKSILQSLADVERHLQEIHSDISIQTSDFLDKCIKLSHKECRKLINHGIVMRDALQDYFCVPCQCLLPSIDHIDKHTVGRKHQKCIKANTISEDSRNDQQNSNNKSNKNVVSVGLETALELLNKSKFSMKIQPICENESVEDVSNDFTTDETVVNNSMLYSRKFEIYKRFLLQHITRYNGQWYCYLCKSMLQSLAEAERHSQEVHSDISIQTSDFLDKCIKLSRKECRKLINHGIVMRNALQDYFCVFCQCSVHTLDHIDQHITEEKHQKCIKASTILEDSTNHQQNSNNNKSNKNDVSVGLEIALKLINKSKLSTKMQPICENESVEDVSNGFTTDETIVNNSMPCSCKFKRYTYLLLQHITRYNGQWYCYLCKSMLQCLADAERHSQEVHSDISIRTSDFLDKCIKLSRKECRKLINHGIVMRDALQDYFCVPCQCSVPTLDHIGEHITGEKHQQYIKANAAPEDSTNEQISNDNENNKNDASVGFKTALELLNKSKLSMKVQPICENESVEDVSNDFTTDETIINNPMPCSRKFKRYKYFLVQHITRYNGQWYCYLCKSMLKSLAEAERHSQEVHPDISTQMTDFLDKSIEFSETKCRKLLNHGIVIKDLPQDYFCVSCQCLLPSLDHIDKHITGKKHQKFIKASTIPEDSTNEQQNSNDNTNNENDVSVDMETLSELLNELNLSTKIQPICEKESVKHFSNGLTANETIVNTCTYVPYSRKFEMYKRFLLQRITCYNGQWYCYLCKSMLKSLAEAERHAQKVHPDINTQMTDFLDKSIELSETKCRELLNHGIIIKDLQDYFCVSCQCSVPSLDHIGQHITGKKHQQCIKTCIISEDSIKNDQPNPNNNKNSKKSNVSVIIGIPEKYANDAKLLTEMQLICENGLRKDLSDVCKTEENIVSFTPYKKDSNNSNILQIERCANMVFCSLCDEFIVKTCIERHFLGKKHISLISALKIFNKQTINCKCIINFEEKREIIQPLQLNSRKLGGIWPEYNTEMIAKYTCAHCNKIIGNDDIINHEITLHKNSMTSSRRYVNDCSSMNRNITLSCIMFKCSFCNEIIHGILLLQIHFSNCHHKRNIALLTEIEEQDYDICENIQNYFEPLEFLNLILFEKNEKTAKIMEQSMIYIKNHHTTFQKNLNNSVQQKFIYVCIACQCIFHDTQTIIDHLSNKKTHLKHFQNVILTYDYIYDAPMSKEFNIKETQAVKSPVCTKDMSINTMEEYNINETQVNAAHYYISKLTTIAKNDTLYQNGENNSGLFMSPDIFMEINKIIKMLPAEKLAKFPQTRQNINNMSVLEHYNRMYQKKFLDFEEIMFSCSQKKLEEIKSNLQFYVPYFNAKRMLCLVCNVKHSFDIHSLYAHIHCEHHITQLTQLQESNEDFKLKLLKELIKIELIDAKCYACDPNTKLVYRNKSRIKDHVYVPSHNKNRRKLFEEVENILEEFKTLWYSIGYFACVACNMRFKMKIEFMQHLNEKHKTVLSTRNNSKFDYCITCSTLWYEDTNLITTYQLHCQQEMHQYLARCTDFAVRSLPQTLQELLKNIDKIIADLFKLSNDILNDPKSIQLMDALKYTFETYPFSLEVCMFGSRVTGLALPNSDIDIYLDFGDECTEDTLIQSRSKEIQHYLHSDCKNWEIESVSDKSRTPVINVKHRLTGLECDISFMNGLAVENSKLIRSFIMAYPPCQKLILFLRKWMSLGCLTGFNGISNYALAWLVIFYLQVEYKIPSVAALIENHNQSKIISGKTSKSLKK